MEWLLIGISAGIVGMICLQLSVVSRAAGLVLLVALGGSLVAAKRWQDRRLEHLAVQSQHQEKLPSEGRPGGYVTSESCRACHPNEYASWHMSYHRTMTQYASPESLKANFNHPPLTHLGQAIELEQVGDEYWVEMVDPDWTARKLANPNLYPDQSSGPRVRRRIGMVTGSHSMQVFWVPGEQGNLQHVFPYSYLFESERWVPFKDTFLRDPEMPIPTQLWNMNCISCHATAGQTRSDFQQRTVDTRAAELGIACESCHGPAEEHVAFYRNPLSRFQADREGAVDPTIANPAKMDAVRSSMVCGQCHGIGWVTDPVEANREGFRYRPGGELNQNRKLVRVVHKEDQAHLRQALGQNPRFLYDRYWSDGMVRVSGRDYTGMMEAPCHQNGELSCLSCHDLHHDAPDSKEALMWRNDQLTEHGASNEACLQCHESFRVDVAAHTHHPEGSAGSHCYNCHMPHTTYGLLKAIRSHHIDNPSVQSSLDTGRPNACNLCHLDQSLEWAGEHLTAWYDQPKPRLNREQREVAASLLWLLKGDAGQRALLAWHYGWEPAQLASGDDWMPFAVAQGLVDPYSAVRFISYRSLKSFGGFGDLDYDFIGPESGRQAALEQAEKRWEAGRDRGAIGTSRTLMNSDGSPQRLRYQNLIRRRNNRSMDLQE